MSTSDVSPPQLPSPSQQRLAMAPALKLYAPSANKNAAKALIAAEYNGVKLDQPPFEMGVTNKTPAFLKLNPLVKARNCMQERVGILRACGSTEWRQCPFGGRPTAATLLDTRALVVTAINRPWPCNSDSATHRCLRWRRRKEASSRAMPSPATSRALRPVACSAAPLWRR